jgi:RNA polymerase sigma-70 factor (ECF subfamily)
VIAAVKGSTVGDEATAAIGQLCETYWYPLYAYARRRGYSADDAADLTQSFFSRLLDERELQAADPQRGRFRSFLLTVFKRFIARQEQRQQAQKRGGGRAIISLDLSAGEDRYRIEPVDRLTAEQLFERRWAMTVLEVVLSRLRTEYRERGQEEFFRAARPWLSGDGASESYDGVAAKLGTTAGALRVAVHRMRQRCRELLRHEVAGTLEDSAAIDDEILRLRKSLGG